jgi:glycosyltransferase involved in cell wall biosynthesis
MITPILSIIIPTKNRYDYLKYIVENFKNYNFKNCEIVISDNSDVQSEIFMDYLSRLGESNINYHFINKPVSIIENSDNAINLSSGKYVIFIGDDDIVLSNILEVVMWMDNNSIDALKCLKPLYYWPNQKPNYLSNDLTGRLIIQKNKIKYTVDKIDILNELKKITKQGGTSIGKLPTIYHSIIKREKLERIFLDFKTYFPGPSPDMANAIALSYYLNSAYYLNFPFVISGKCNKSGGGKGVNHDHVGDLKSLKHLPNDVLENWDNRIPKYWTAGTIWSQSVSVVLKGFSKKRIYSNMRLDYSFLYAHLFVFNFKQRKILFGKNWVKSFLEVIFYVFIVFSQRSLHFILYRLSYFTLKVSNMKDITAAKDFVESIMDHKLLSKFYNINK